MIKNDTELKKIKLRTKETIKITIIYPLVILLGLATWFPAFSLVRTNVVEQQPPILNTNSFTEEQLNNFLELARKQIIEYRNLFKNLTCKEIKTIEELGKKGNIEKKRQIVSDLVVYQASSNTNQTREFRNVYEVDGVAVKDRDNRVEKLFERLAKTTDIEKELKQIDKEGLRYDLSNRYTGQTINQAFCLQKAFSSLFKFEFDSTTKLTDQEVIIIKYEQKTQDKSKLPYEVNFPSELKPAEIFIRGKLWIDAKTHQLWKEEREDVIRSQKQEELILFGKSEFNYAPSKFGILLPEKFVFNNFSKPYKEQSRVFTSRVDSSINFEYSSFSKFDVTVKED